MSLLKKASIITTPTAYAEDFLYNIKPAGGLGNELITNGTFDTDSNWTKGTGWSIANGKATVTSSITDSIYQDALTLGKTFKVTFEITNITSGSLRVGIGINFSDYFTEVGTYTFYGQPSNDTLLRINPSSGTNASIDNVSVKEVADFDFTRNSTGTRLNEDYLIETVATNTPRIDYTNGEPSILLEPSRTNLFEYDIDFSQSVWTKANVTLQSNTAISPEGIQNASNIYPTNNVAYIYNTTTASSSVYTVSAYVKANGKNVAWLYSNSGSTNGTIYFDLSDESMQVVAGSGGTPTGTINKMPNGWYRITYTTGTAISLTGGSGVGVSDAKGSLNATQNGTDGILVYGLQIEAGSYPTSLIHTSGSAVTRSADVANNAGNSDLFNNSEGVLYAEIKKDTNALDNSFGMITIGDAINNRVQIALIQNSNNFDALVGTSSGIYNTVNPFNYGSYNKIALSYNSSGFKVFHDGTLVGSDSNAISGLNLQELKFRFANNTFYDMYANIKMVAVFKEALSDEELECLTGYNNHELYMNYYNRLSYLGLAEEYNVESDINNYIL